MNRLLMITFLFFCIGSTELHADLVGSFSGVVDSVDGQLAGGFSPGETFSGTFLIDDSVSDVLPDPTRGFYPSAVLGFSFEFSGGYSGSTSAVTSLGVANDTFDEIGIEEFFSGDVIAGASPTVFEFSLFDSTATALISDAIPTLNDFSAFDQRTLDIFFDSGGQEFGVFGTITSGSITAVPEPTSLATFMLLMLTQCTFRRNRNRDASGTRMQ